VKVVTAGKKYLDIDAFAGMIGYAELLRLRGVEAVVVSSAKPNESVTRRLREFDEIERNYEPGVGDGFVVLDVSDPEHFDPMVDMERVEEVIDHHPGYEKYWTERIGNKAEIEPIGAVCTIIYEKWRDAGLLSEMRKSSATLLAAGILDNTLNLGAKITTERDKEALSSLSRIGELSEGYSAEYFSEIQGAVEADIPCSIRDDTKILFLEGLGREIRFGQLAVWDGERILPEVAKLGAEFDFMNFIDISGKRSVFVTYDRDIKEYFEKLLGVKFVDGIAEAGGLWLRKEILRESLLKK